MHPLHGKILPLSEKEIQEQDKLRQAYFQEKNEKHERKLQRQVFHKKLKEAEDKRQQAFHLCCEQVDSENKMDLRHKYLKGREQAYRNWHNATLMSLRAKEQHQRDQAQRFDYSEGDALFEKICG